MSIDDENREMNIDVVLEASTIAITEMVNDAVGGALKKHGFEKLFRIPFQKKGANSSTYLSRSSDDIRDMVNARESLGELTRADVILEEFAEFLDAESRGDRITELCQLIAACNITLMKIIAEDELGGRCE